MNIKTTLKTTVAAAALFAIAAPAVAGSVQSRNDTTTFKLTGQVNKAFAYIDNGAAARGQVVENDISRSRLHAAYSTSVNEAVTVKGRFELMFSDNDLSSTGVVDSAATGEAGANVDGGADNSGSVTESWISVEHKQLGTFQIGKLEEASDRAWTNGPNPAGNAVDAGSALLGSVDLHTSSATDNTFSGSTVGQFFQAFEGSGGANMVGYVTPSLGGAKLLVSYANDSDVDFGVSYGGKFGGFAVDVYGGYKNSSGSGSIDSQWGVSGGVSHDSGFSLGAGYGTEDSEASGQNDADGYWILAGYEANLVSMGATGFAFQYLSVDEATGTKGDEGKAYSFGVEQGLAPGLSAYAGYTLIQVDRTATNFDDVSLLMAGMRLNF